MQHNVSSMGVRNVQVDKTLLNQASKGFSLVTPKIAVKKITSSMGYVGNRAVDIDNDTLENRSLLETASKYIEIKTSYLNNTGKDVVIMLRNSFKVTVSDVSIFNNPVNTGPTIPCAFYRLDTYKIGPLGRKAMNEFVLSIDETASPTMHEIKHAYEEAVRISNQENSPFMRIEEKEISFTIYSGINAKDIENASNVGVYSPELDLLISFKDLMNAPAHPYCGYAVKDDTLFGSDLDTQERYKILGVRMEIVDNKRKYQEKYIYAFNRVYSITPKKDDTKADGFYMYSTNDSTYTYSNINFNSVCCTISEAKELYGLCDSEEEARGFGDMKTKQALELQKLKFEADRKAAKESEKDAKRKAKAEKEKNKLAMEKYEQDMTKIKAEKIKASILSFDTYSKVFPALVTIGGALAVAWGVMKSKFKTA